MLAQCQEAAEKGLGRLNACPTIACNLSIHWGGAGAFALRSAVMQAFFSSLP